MLRMSILLGVAVVYCGGCTPASETRNLEFQLRKVEGERDGYKQRLASEQAKSLALQKRMDTVDLRWSADRTKVASLSAHARELAQSNDQLTAALTQIENRRLTRPEVSVSPLPAEVDRALQAFAGKLPERVWYERARGAISFANDRLFDPGSDAIRSDAHAALHELAGILAMTSADEFEIVVVGHTDATPITKPETLARHPSNWHLSVHRAIAVQNVLIKAGLPPARLGVMGYGPYRPLGDDLAQNRRVEVFVVRKGGVQPFQPVRSTSS